MVEVSVVPERPAEEPNREILPAFAAVNVDELKEVPTDTLERPYPTANRLPLVD